MLQADDPLDVERLPIAFNCVTSQGASIEVMALPGWYKWYYTAPTVAETEVATLTVTGVIIYHF